MAAQAKIGVIGMSVCIFNWQSNQLQLNNWVSQLISTVCNWQLATVCNWGSDQELSGKLIKNQQDRITKGSKNVLKTSPFFL